jgi:hypothetical protein
MLRSTLDQNKIQKQETLWNQLSAWTFGFLHAARADG